MEGILTELTIGPGVFLGALALLIVALEGILLGYVADLEKAGKRFFWTETSTPENELVQFLPRDVALRRAA